jgi:DNA mismatch repair protein MLH1
MKTLSQHKVRTSLKERTLDSMFPVLNPARINSPPGESENNTATPGSLNPREVKESECYLTSVKQLRRSVLKGKHKCEDSRLSIHL